MQCCHSNRHLTSYPTLRSIQRNAKHTSWMLIRRSALVFNQRTNHLSKSSVISTWTWQNYSPNINYRFTTVNEKAADSLPEQTVLRGRRRRGAVTSDDVTSLSTTAKRIATAAPSAGSFACSCLLAFFQELIVLSVLMKHLLMLLCSII